MELVDRTTGEVVEPVLVDRRTGEPLDARRTRAVYRRGDGTKQRRPDPASDR